MLDNKQEFAEDKEPRRGIAPFAEGFENIIDKNTKPDTITSKPIPFRGIGNVEADLYRPLDDDRLNEEVGEDTAFTFDLSGKITRGKARDLIKQGYYMVKVFINYPGAPAHSLTQHQDLQVGLWLDNTEPIVSSEFIEEFGKTTDRA